MTPNQRALAALLPALLAAAPLATSAQGFALRPPSIGDALRDMDRLVDRAGRRPPLEQTFVIPERPGQNQVAWFDFDWRELDVPSPAGGRGGMRLYFYERERPIAARALPSIRSSYLRLVDQFRYSPTKRIPYILYSSQREFQATNLFQITEGTLGVTSPQDLKMSLPYFGIHERFREVSMHELVHQFTIQKLIDLAPEDGESAINALPLWFIEGIAEYYSKGGIDAETDGYLRDLVWNPDPDERYEVLPFAEDRVRGYIPTYKLGQARVAFIADAYGEEKVQGFLEAVASDPGRDGGDRAFAALVRRVLNEPLEQVDQRWRAWLKRRYYPQYLRVRQDLPALRELRDLPSEPESFSASADGTLVLFRAIDRQEGRARLYLMDARDPRGAVEVAADSKPGVESLHPIDRAVTALADGALAFAAQSGAADVLYVQPFRHEPPAGRRRPRLALGARRRLEVVPPAGLRILEIADPTFSPDGAQLAFVGLTDRGQQDVFIVPAGGGAARQLTDDAWSERDLAWATDGIHCSSDATDHGGFNLFRLDAATGAPTRLTTAADGDRHPRPLPDGSVLFTSGAGGKNDLWEWRAGSVRRLTDFATGLTSPAPATAGGVYASAFYRGRFRLVEVPKVALLDEPAAPVPPAPAPPLGIPVEPIPPTTPPYDAWARRNWRPEAGIVYGGGAQNAVAGRAALLFSDLLRDHILYLDLAIYGSLDYTQALVLFEDRSRRANFAFGAYHFVQQQIDRLDPALAYFQRDFGVLGVLRHPLNRYQRFETELTLGGVNRYCLTDYSTTFTTDCDGPATGREAWEQRNGGVSFAIGPTVRYGYDTVRLDPLTGPISGRALLAELGGGWIPARRALHGFSRIEAATFFPLLGRSNLTLRVGGATSFAPDANGRSWSRTWWLTSGDNLRGFHPFDLPYLIGSHYYVTNAELQVPLNAFVRLFIFDYVEAVAAVDFGGVFNRLDDRVETIGGRSQIVEPGAWGARTLTGVLGANVLFGPLLLRVHFGHPFDIGGQRTPALVAGESWVTNVTLRYFFM